MGQEEKLGLSRRRKWRPWGKRGKGREEHTDTLAKGRQWVEVWRRAWRWVLVLHTFPGKRENVAETRGDTEPPSQHTHLRASHTQQVALMNTFSNCLHLSPLEQSFGTRPEIHTSNTTFVWCKEHPLHPAAAPGCLLSPLQGGNQSPNLFYCFGQTTGNSYRSLESSCEGEDKERKAVRMCYCFGRGLGRGGGTALCQSGNNPSVGTVRLQKSTFTRKAYFTFTRKAYFTWQFLQTTSTTAVCGEVCIREPR